MFDDDERVTGEDLKTFDGDFADAPDDEFKPIPDGSYQVRIDRAQLKKLGGYPALKWEFVILAGANAGQRLFKTSFISSEKPDNFKYLKRDLGRCGIILPMLSALPEFLTELIEIELEVEKKTSDKRDKKDRPYVNVYIQRRIETNSKPEPKQAGGHDEPPPIDDSDIPF